MELPRVWNEQRGSLLLWIDGRPVGNPEEIEMISIGLGSLWESAEDTANCSGVEFEGNSPAEALDRVMEARYGDSEKPDDLQIERYEVLPLWTGPSFDGWEAILIPEGGLERFIFRQGTESAHEARWERGTFLRVVTEARSQFEASARSAIER